MEQEKINEMVESIEKIRLSLSEIIGDNIFQCDEDWYGKLLQASGRLQESIMILQNPKHINSKKLREG